MQNDASHASVGQVRVLYLKNGAHLESDLYRLKTGWTIQFRLSACLFGKKVTLFTDHPFRENEDYVRSCYRELPWQFDNKTNRHDDTAAYANMHLFLPGSFHFYYVCDDSNVPNGSGYFVVDPVLRYGKDDEELPLDCIQCQTNLSKCLGPLSQWKQRLTVSREAGYNMIHFTPVQELGSSKSCYSLRNHQKLNPNFTDGKTEYSMRDLDGFLKMMRIEWKMLSLTDIVLNHIADNSPWLQQHPECAYNLENSPHLRPAYLFDQVLCQFNGEIADGKWESSGIPKVISCEEHLQIVKNALHGFFLPQVKLHEFYMMDVGRLVTDFKKRIVALKGPSSQFGQSSHDLKILQDPQFRRLQCTVDKNKSLFAFNVNQTDCHNEAERVDRCCIAYRKTLEELNGKMFELIQCHLKAGVENVLCGARYERLQEDGPRKKEISVTCPLFPRYFTNCGPSLAFEEDEAAMFGDKACFGMAHNGWVMNDDPFRNFAERDSNVYLRRELIVWSDSVKLRYGAAAEDCPFLWQYMRTYVENTAEMFHGIRLDNCHSTPIGVAQYMLDAARKKRKDLYVVAELFTGSDKKDNVFINKLGINSLIREAMSAYDAHEEGRLVFRYGGDPVGAFYHCSSRPLVPSIAHAIFFDQTHDNPSPVQKRSVYDLLPSTAIVNMTCCATGSNRGYDELVPHAVDVVTESRLYPSWNDNPSLEPDSTSVSAATGIIAAKKLLHQLHYDLGKSGYNQVYVDQIDADIVTITRHCPETHQSVVMVAFTAFTQPLDSQATRYVRPLCIQGRVDEVVLEARLTVDSGEEAYKRSESFVNGMRNVRVDVKRNVQLKDSEILTLGKQGSGDQLEIGFRKLTPGSIVAIRVSLSDDANGAVTQLRKYACLLGYDVGCTTASTAVASEQIVDVLNSLTLVDLNKVLFRSDSEEQDDSPGNGVYAVPNYGPLTYAGLQGLVSLLRDIHMNNDLGHPLCDNIRQGDWLSDYVVCRLQRHPSLNKFANWLSGVLKHLKIIPRYLVPSYFDAIICGVYLVLLARVWQLMSSFVSDGTEFVKALALGSVVLGGVVRSAPLPRLSSNVSAPLPPSLTLDGGATIQTCTTLAAGLPHFSTGYMRNWGRDTFIALKGMYLLTGRYKEALFIILGFAGCLRHGLIPNLLDGGRNARFNCRDAVWWWLQSIQDYTVVVPDGHKLLKEPVLRLFPSDDSTGDHVAVEQSLEDVVHEALQRHFEGVAFRERNAGFNLDREMSDSGFNNCIGVNLETGFVFGGNAHNCGTWMDKMGSSDIAGNKGKPATPRDGSAVEIVGLSKSCLRWLIEMNAAGFYSHDSVTRVHNGVKKTMSLVEWDNRIKACFEKHFWIGSDSKEHGDPHPELINRTGIYKDTLGASQQWTDYQLRCNFPVAMVVAPELFTPRNAWEALNVAENVLLGPLGMKTLDPSDWAYNGFYDNDDNSSNTSTARGFNYHQGPEWLWPIGYFLQAKLHFARLVGGDDLFSDTVSFVKTTLSRHYQELHSSVWRGLPELTNQDGAHCKGSCSIQAWSMASILQVLYDICNS